MSNDAGHSLVRLVVHKMVRLGSYSSLLYNLLFVIAVFNVM